MLGDRIRRASLVAVIAAMAIVGAAFLAPNAKAEGAATNRFIAETNAARAAAGLPDYAYAGDLAAVAQGQAERMAARSDVYHNPDLGSDVSGWKKAGENVGAGNDPDQIHNAFMASPAHQANILSAAYTELGIGTAVGGDGRLYVAEVFRLPSSQPQTVPPRIPLPPRIPSLRPSRPLRPIPHLPPSRRRLRSHAW